MKKLWLVLPLSILVSGCAAAAYQVGPAHGGYAARQTMYPQPMRVQAGPIGRWDNVMMLGPGSTVQVLMADGALVKGAVVWASISSLRVRAGAGDLDLAVTDVMRVDRVKAPGPGPVRNGAVGAAWGAGLVAALGLVLRRMPPPQVIAAGAAYGANQSVQYGRLGFDPVTIYVSPAVTSGARPEVK